VEYCSVVLGFILLDNGSVLRRDGMVRCSMVSVQFRNVMFSNCFVARCECVVRPGLVRYCYGDSVVG